MPIKSGMQRRGVGSGRFDYPVRRGCDGWERRRSGDSNLRGIAARTERSAVLNVCATLVAGMLHSISRYSRDAWFARNGALADGRGRRALH